MLPTNQMNFIPASVMDIRVFNGKLFHEAQSVIELRVFSQVAIYNLSLKLLETYYDISWEVINPKTLIHYD